MLQELGTAGAGNFGPAYGREGVGTMTALLDRAIGRTAVRRSLLILSMVLASAANAQVFYTHSPAEEKTATQITEGLASAKAAHLGAIGRHRQFLQEALGRERTLVAERELAQRDAMVAEILEQQDDTDNPRSELNSELEGRLGAITGLEREAILSLQGAAGRQLVDKAGDLERLRGRFIDNDSRRGRAIRAFQQGGGRGRFCGSTGRPEPTVEIEGSNPEALAVLSVVCGRLRSIADEQQRVVAGVPAELLSILGQPTDLDRLRSGEIRLALAQSASLAALAEQQGALANAAKSHLTALEAYYRCQQEHANDPGISAELQAVATQIRDFIDWLETLSSATLLEQLRNGAASDPQSAGGDSCRTTDGRQVERPRRIDNAVRLADQAGITREDVDTAVARVAELDPIRSVIAAVHEEAQQFESTAAAQLLAILASGTTPADDTQEARAAAALFRMIDNAQQLSRARNGTLPDVSGVLVRLAAARMKVATARVEAARLQELRRLADLRLAAIRREAIGLVAAYQLLNRGRDQPLQRALLRYADSWTEGRTPARVLDYDMHRAEYFAWSDRERVTVEAAYAVLEPAAAELQAYGAGGFRASDIARYLNVIGLGAIAVGGE